MASWISSLAPFLKYINIGGILNMVLYTAAFIMIALAIVTLLKPPKRTASPAGARYAKLVSVQPPKKYDMIVYVVDDTDSTITKEGFIKISDRLYVSTTAPTPSFLYVPEKTKLYLCRDGKSIVPCALGYRRNILTLLANSELAATQELMRDSSLISIDKEELSKLLAHLYREGSEKVGYVPVSPNTKIAVKFNMDRIARSFLDVLRSADEMLIHFLNTAGQAESIERFMKAAAKMQEARLSWLRWLVIIILGSAIAYGIVQMFKPH